MLRCKICKTPIGDKYGSYCRNCHTVLLQLKEILFDPYLDGSIDLSAKKFLLEIDFLFMRNLRVQSIFNLAWHMWLDLICMGSKEIDLSECDEFQYIKLSKQEEVLKILSDAQIIKRISNNKVRPGMLMLAAKNVRYKGEDFASIEWREAVSEMRAILTIAITLSLIKLETFVPRDISCIMELLSQHMFNHMSDTKIPDTIPKSVYEKIFKRLPIRQKLKMKIDLIGLNPWGARIINDINSTGDIILKKSVISYLEFVRVRLRERGRLR